ncbi:MAG: Npt1/Npt2 family nucleotide transporter [Steroidobacteraceae bacterium]
MTPPATTTGNDALPVPPSRGGVAAGEWVPLLSAALAYFALLAGYYMLRSLREAFALEVGREHIDRLFYATFVVMLAVLPAYWFAVARIPRRRLLASIYGFVVLLFAGLGLALQLRLDPSVVGAIYFVAVSSLNLFMVSVFWSTMVDAWHSEAAKRVFGYIAAGGSVGALAGPLFNSLFIERLGPAVVIGIACLMIGAAAMAGRWAQVRTRSADPVDGRGLELAVGGRAIDDLRRLATSPYMLGIASLIVAGQVLGGYMYNEQAKYVETAYATLESRAALFARIDFFVNVVSLVFQSLVVAWLTRLGGMRLALAAIPLLLIGSLVVLALVPVGAVLLATQVLRRGVDYGLFKPTREMLFTVLNPESKFKSKSLIDTLLQRGATASDRSAIRWSRTRPCRCRLGLCRDLRGDAGLRARPRARLPAT